MLDVERLEAKMLARARALEVMAPAVQSIEAWLSLREGTCWSKAIETQLKALTACRVYCHTYAMKFPYPYIYVHVNPPAHLSNPDAGGWCISVDLFQKAVGERMRIRHVCAGGYAFLQKELQKLRAFNLEEALAKWRALEAGIEAVQASVPACILDKFYARMHS